MCLHNTHLALWYSTSMCTVSDRRTVLATIRYLAVRGLTFAPPSGPLISVCIAGQSCNLFSLNPMALVSSLVFAGDISGKDTVKHARLILPVHQGKASLGLKAALGLRAALGLGATLGFETTLGLGAILGLGLGFDVAGLAKIVLVFESVLGTLGALDALGTLGATDAFEADTWVGFTMNSKRTNS